MPDEQGNETIPELREAAERGREATREAEAIRRENAFLKAGIDPDSPRAKYFVKGYDGELTKDAILAEAKEAGILETTQATTEDAPPAARREATEDETEMDTLAAAVAAEAAPPGGQPPADGLKEGWSTYSERRKEGATREDAAAAVIGSVISGAVEGDKRFLA